MEEGGNLKFREWLRVIDGVPETALKGRIATMARGRARGKGRGEVSVMQCGVLTIH